MHREDEVNPRFPFSTVSFIDLSFAFTRKRKKKGAGKKKRGNGVKRSTKIVSRDNDRKERKKWNKDRELRMLEKKNRIV